MAVAALVRNAKCHVCRHDLLQSFTRISGLTIAQSLRQPNQPQTRRFFAVPNLRTESSNLNPEHNISNEIIQNATALNESAKSPESVPWYLQVEPATETAHPAVRQREIPAVPEDAPPITKDMLQHLADEIGLDDMALLDLRGRDPPPALGASLIMIIGSARSLKHLNVSADRFCRWLRSTYKLRPYADGLLGRNELKIKLRRKARRARLASSSGAIADSSDDGITTGWICVNVGSVDDPSASVSIREGGFEGFGKVQGGTRIVVQMFTEEKRADVDLEKLWAPKPDTKIQSTEASNESIVTEDHQVRPEFDMTTQRNSNQPISNTFRRPVRLEINQRRSFSTSSRRHSAGYGQGYNFPQYINDIPVYLKGLSAAEILEQLGSGPEDKESTEFLRNSWSFPQSEEDYSKLRLILAAAGIHANAPGYSKEYLWALFLSHTGSGFELDPELAIYIADALANLRLFKTPEEDAMDPRLVHFDNESALRVLDYASLSGADLLTHQRVFNVIYKVLRVELLIQKPETVKKKALGLRAMMDKLDFDWRGDVSRETMSLRFIVGDVEGFYEIWHAIAFNEMTRTAEDYGMLFELHAVSGNANSARECLAVWIPMMGRENPPIQPDSDLITVLARCAHAAGYKSGSEFGLIGVSSDWSDAHPLIVDEMKSLEESA